MLIDNTLVFTPSPQAVTSSTVESTNVLDLSGLGSGNVVTNIIGIGSTFGGDPGVGKWAQQIYITVGTAFTTSDSCTLTINLQGAADDAGSPGTYYTLSATGAFAVANLAAGTVIRLDWNVVFPNTLIPRFFRLQYVPSATMTAGTVGFAAVTSGRPDFYSMQQAPINYTVAY